MRQASTENNGRTRQLVKRYQTSIALVFPYLILVVLNVVLVWHERQAIARVMDGSYHDPLVDYFVAGYWIWLFGIQGILFVIGLVIALLVDRNRAKMNAVPTDTGSRVHLIVTASIVSIFLILPAFWIYILNRWSLWQSITFATTANPQQRLNRDFRERTLSSNYDRVEIEAFLKRGADVNTCGLRGSPLTMAAQAEDEEFVHRLLALGANVNALDFRRKTALTYALEGDSAGHKFSDRRKRIALFLIKHGASAGSGDYASALNTAIRSKRDKELIVRLLDEGIRASGHAKDRILSEAVSTAAYSGNNDALSLLAERSADINHRADLNTPLTSAVQAHQFETARLLIARGADVNVRDQNRATPVMLAAEWKSPALLNLLLKSGADISGEDNRSRTVLAYAASTGDISRVKRLLSLGAKVDLEGRSGKEALAAAIEANSPEMVKLFIDLGVNVNGVFYGRNGTLLMKATIHNPGTKSEIVRLLEDAGAKE